MTRRSVQNILLTLAAGLFVYPAAAEHPALSGTWRLDVAESRFGSMPPPDSGVLTISTGPHKIFRISLTTKSPHHERTIESEWKLDDRFHPIEGDASGEVLAKWQGSVLVGRRLTGNGVEEIRFRLGPGNESLTESIQSGADVTTLIWRRQ